MDSYGLFSAMDISSSGMTAQRLRMDTIASNIANSQSTRTPQGGPYRRKEVIFASILTRKKEAMGVKVVDIVSDDSPLRLIYNPQHPDANPAGYVAMPNVNIITEMIDMISATRSYEANITAFKSAQIMADKALEIGRR